MRFHRHGDSFNIYFQPKLLKKSTGAHAGGGDDRFSFMTKKSRRRKTSLWGIEDFIARSSGTISEDYITSEE